ncbi:amino acid synthesis family protein [bacterium]|nr:MAG: amino acid synthesis family protein [bacterium]
MEPEIRKIVTVTEEVRIEGGKKLARPVRMSAAIAVIKNPLAGRFEADLSLLSGDYSTQLGPMLAELAIKTLGTKPEAFGKGALVGTAGEIVHGSSIIHTPAFGGALRKVTAGAGPVPSAEKRGATGAQLDMSMRHQHDAGTLDGTRASHLFSFSVNVADAPFADEIVVVAAVADGGRPDARQD